MYRPAWFVSFALFAVIGMWAPSSAHAQVSDADKARAKKLYEEADVEATKRNYAAACPKLEKALEIWPNHVRTAITLAECHDHLGKLATALHDYEKAREVAVQQKQSDKVKEIDEKVAVLAPRVPRLQILVSNTLKEYPELTITCDGVAVPADQWGKHLYAVNPGKRQIEASAFNCNTWRTSVDAAAGEVVDVKVAPKCGPLGPPAPQEPPVATPTKPENPPVSKPPLEPAPPKSAPPEAEIKPPPESRPSVDGAPLRQETSGVRIAGQVFLGLGAVSGIVGATLGGLAISKNSASDKGHCDAHNVCDDAGYDLRLEAQRFGNGSTAGFVVAGVLLGTGGILVAVAPSKTSKKAPSVGANLWLGPTSIGLAGRW